MPERFRSPEHGEAVLGWGSGGTGEPSAGVPGAMERNGRLERRPEGGGEGAGAGPLPGGMPGEFARRGLPERGSLCELLAGIQAEKRTNFFPLDNQHASSLMGNLIFRILHSHFPKSTFWTAGPGRPPIARPADRSGQPATCERVEAP